MKNNRKTVDDRQMNILNMVRERGEIKVEEIAEKFSISPMTVRRDLKYLEQESLLLRTHGGAVSLDKAHLKISKDEKIAMCRRRISEYAIRFIDDGDTLFINGSQTALHMVDHIKNKRVNIVTNNCWGFGLNIPEGVSIHYTGGEVRSNVMIGEYVLRNLLNMSADKTFLGCAAVYDDGEFRYDIPTEIGINEVMISRTRKGIYILADHTKLQKREMRDSTYGSCTYDCPVTLITDDNANTTVVEKLRKQGIHVILVPTK